MSSKQESGGGAIYFQNSKNSEIAELQNELNTMKIEHQKDAMKQIIASMTIGKDVSQLFPHVVKCMRTTSIELKKLIYLYIINYAKSKPDLTFLAINAFNQDAQDKASPLVRALAVRTIGCIRVDKVISYLCDTLNACLKDEDAYVRKTACICVAKLYNTNPSYVRENAFIETLTAMLTDGNASVVANALAALNEISTLCGENFTKIKSKTLKRILVALPESNEWGQIYILDSLVRFTPKKPKQADEIIESVLPRLNHANPAVVMSAVKVVLKFLDWIESPDNVRNYCKKISNSLMTVMMAGPEIQYVLLRSLHAIVEKRPYLLDKDFKYFYVEYNDPIYVKLEKIDILYKLNDSKNFESILAELKNYAIMEFDTELVQKSIIYIGNIGFKFEKALELCVDSIKDILEHNQDYTVNQAVIVARDLLRKYKDKPKAKELISKINAELISMVTEPESKAAVLYILGEFCTSIENSTALITNFVDNYAQELSATVKLQIITASIKNYVNKPDETEDLIKLTLQKGGEETDNPDVRDRSYLYWRLLESEPDLAKEMIMGEKPGFEFREDIVFESHIGDNIIENLTNISAVYHKMSHDLIPKEDMVIDEAADPENRASPITGPTNSKSETKLGSPSKETKKANPQAINIMDSDLLGLDSDQSPTTPQISSTNTNYNLMDDIFGLGSGSNQVHSKQSNGETIDEFEFDCDISSSSPSFVDESNSIVIFSDDTFTTQRTTLSIRPNTPGLNNETGLACYSSFTRNSSKIVYGLMVKNYSNSAINSISIMMNNNSFGLNISNQNNTSNISIPRGGSEIIKLDCEISNDKNDKKSPISPFTVDICFKCNLDTFYFSSIFMIHSLFTETGKMANQGFVEFFKANSSNTFNISYVFDNFTLKMGSPEEQLNKTFERNNIFPVAKNNKADPPLMYFSSSISNVIPCVMQVSFSKHNHGSINLKLISNVEPVVPLLKESIDHILSK